MRLIYERGDERISFPLDEGEAYIGRKENCEIHLPDGSLSKRHARLVRRGNELTVFDAGSRNGTLVDDELLTDGMSRRVRNGSVIQCGKLKFVVEGIPEGASGEEFEVLEESEQGGGGVPLAKAIASAEVRPSVMDVLPELESGVRAPTARLVLLEAKQPQSWDLYQETITIGSKPENRVMIEGDGISRYHAEVVWEEGKWVLKDLGSRNGVFVGGARADLHELQDGDELQIGTVKLRFEAIRPNPMAPLMELLNKYKEDPVGSFKQDPRLRMGVAVFLTAIVLVILSVTGSGGAAAVEGPPLAWLEEATQKLSQRDYKGARDQLRKAMATGVVAPEHQSIQRAVAAVATAWAEINPREPDWYMRFSWKRARDLVDSALRVRGLPGGTASWLRETGHWVDMHQKAYDQLGAAQQMAQDARGQAANNSPMEAVGAFKSAIQSYSSVDPRTPMAKQGKEAAVQLTAVAHELLATDLRRRMGVAIPDWDECKKMAQTALEFTSTGEQRADLRRVEEECDINRRDEERYRLAVDIVNNRDLANYRTAIDLLEKVDPRSRIYPDARAYLDWIHADLKVREAKKAYDLGEAERAFALLSEAMQSEVLGPEARMSVQTRRQAWLQVVNSWRRGIGLCRDGKMTEAKTHLSKVLELESNRENWFHYQARSQLQHIAEREAYSLERRLREGLEALQKGHYDQCQQWFKEIRADPNCRGSDLEKVRLAVVEVKRARRMVPEAKRMIMAGRDDSLQLYYNLSLLREWLPQNDRDRPEVEKMFAQVQQRLNLLIKNARQRR